MLLASFPKVNLGETTDTGQMKERKGKEKRNEKKKIKKGGERKKSRKEGSNLTKKKRPDIRRRLCSDEISGKINLEK